MRLVKVSAHRETGESSPILLIRRQETGYGDAHCARVAGIVMVEWHGYVGALETLSAGLPVDGIGPRLYNSAKSYEWKRLQSI